MLHNRTVWCYLTTCFKRAYGISVLCVISLAETTGNIRAEQDWASALFGTIGRLRVIWLRAKMASEKQIADSKVGNAKGLQAYAHSPYLFVICVCG